jgi:hypothetical protein
MYAEGFRADLAAQGYAAESANRNLRTLAHVSRWMDGQGLSAGQLSTGLLAPGLPGLPPGKTPGHPPQQIRQQRGPGIIRYRRSSDCRILIVSPQPIMIAAAAPPRGHPSDLHQQPHGHELQLPW